MQKNRIEIAGYLTAKPELRRLPSGAKVANARLGETYRYIGADKQIHSQTNWHNLTFYAELADIAAGYDKGDNLYIEGTLQQRRFTPKDGVTRTVCEVVVKNCHRIAAQQREAIEAAADEENGVRGLPEPEAEANGDLWPV
jgi:single-strand DNA-binding protein